MPPTTISVVPSAAKPQYSRAVDMPDPLDHVLLCTSYISKVVRVVDVVPSLPPTAYKLLPKAATPKPILAVGMLGADDHALVDGLKISMLARLADVLPSEEPPTT